jgi:hypothetical protein
MITCSKHDYTGINNPCPDCQKELAGVVGLSDWLAGVADRCRVQIVWLRKRQKLTPKLENKIKYGVRRTESTKRLLLILDIKRRLDTFR